MKFLPLMCVAVELLFPGSVQAASLPPSSSGTESIKPRENLRASSTHHVTPRGYGGYSGHGGHISHGGSSTHGGHTVNSRGEADASTPNAPNSSDPAKPRDNSKGGSSSPEPSTHLPSPRAVGGSSTHGGQTVNREADASSPNPSSPSGSSDAARMRDNTKEASTGGPTPRSAGGHNSPGGHSSNVQAEMSTPNSSEPTKQTVGKQL
ncbi:uncharacterized protein LOC141857444 [Brevipalpus obovatus]|uniref:uncharacterized protein LOC141857444 n=1 Tax=Brevipalpus obovatus TaxID=246614 RepID=UPI003D9E5EE4